MSPVLGQMGPRGVRDVVLENVVDWDTSGSDIPTSLTIPFRFGVCDAATSLILDDARINGLLGLGPAL